MRDGADIAARLRLKDVGRISTKHLARSLEENALGRGKNPLQGESGIIDAVFTSDKVRAYQGPVHPRQHVIVHHVDLTKGGPHLADFGHESSRECSKCDVALFQVHALLTKRDEEIAASIRINDRLQPDLGLMHLHGGEGLLRCQWWYGTVACRTDKVADHTNVGIQRLSGRRGSAIVRQLSPCIRDLWLPLNGRGRRRHNRSLRLSRRRGLGSSGLSFTRRLRGKCLRALQRTDLSFKSNEPVLQVAHFLLQRSILGCEIRSIRLLPPKGERTQRRNSNHGLLHFSTSQEINGM